MYAIILDDEKYLKSYSDRVKTPESIVVNSIPNEEDPEKLRCYQYIKKKYVFDAEKWAAIEASRAETARITETQRKINELKDALNATDYQIIKCYEYALNNLELPYDAAALHSERQTLRDQINELQATLNN